MGEQVPTLDGNQMTEALVKDTMAARTTTHLRPAGLAGLLFVFLLVATACQNSEPTAGATTSTSAPTTTTVEVPGGFDDHTRPEIASVEVFEGLARVDGIQSAVKFAIPDLSAPGVVWMDSSFYELHDEWYWFRLLNGHAVPGLATEPVDVGPATGFQTIDEVYAWASTRRTSLPLDLRFIADGGRLYSDEYYDLTLRDPDKTYGLGTLVRYDVDGGQRWVIEMQFSEATTPASVEQFVDRLSESLPDEISESLAWVPRSPDQAATADELDAAGWGDGVVRYADLVPQGDVAVYNPGLTAGRLLLIENPSDLQRARPDDILVMENVPDWLPPATAMLTSNPQTPLAHVNLLARNRGIPNVSVSGLLDDPAISIAARSRAHAVVSATSNGQLQVTLITREQFTAWDGLRAPAPIAVPAVDLATTPTVLSLTELAAGITTEADVAALRPSIGGKSAGFLALLGADGVSTPDAPLAITVAPYFRHLRLVESELEAMLDNVDFQAESRIRFLLLEGPEEFAETYTSEADAAAADAFADQHTDGPIRTILDADGFMNLFRDTVIDAADLAEITDAITANFDGLSPLQGLRFRSSSSVEDIEGFSGAGLYDSNTGFVDPLLQADEGDHKKTIERTIKKTWASYWSYEAYEERRLENVDHRSGGMGVLVHPRFDDALEANNGVATLTLMPDSHPVSAVVTINVQDGDVSVANPEADSDVLPEQIVVRVDDDGQIEIERLAASTLVSDGQLVMSDEAVLELIGQLEATITLWRDRVNADLDPSQRVEVVTLDFEFKHMDAGWPAMADGDERPSRLVVKQARSLDPALRGMPAEVLDLPIPRDLLARANVVERVDCTDGVTGLSVATSAAAAEVGFDPVVWLSSATEPDDTSSCERSTLFGSPEQVLVELLASGEGLTLG